MSGLWSKSRKRDAKSEAEPAPDLDRTARTLAALATVDFQETQHLSSIWDDFPHHVSDLNGAIVDQLSGALFACTRPQSRSPLGRVVVGQAGAGKTHLLGTLRRVVWDGQGWFVLLDLCGVRDFWATAALNYLGALNRPHLSGRTQGQELLVRLWTMLSAQPPAQPGELDAIFHAGDERILDLAARTIALLRHDYWDKTQGYQHIIRAVVMHQGRNVALWDEAMNWLQGVEADGGRLGPVPDGRDVVTGLSWLMSLVGPTLVAIDQLDPIVTAASHALDGGDPDSEEQRKAHAIVDNLAIGLMDLYDFTWRTLTVVTAQEASWNTLNQHAMKSAIARFSKTPYLLEVILNAGVAERVVANRLATAYAAHDVTPPYPTFPFRAEAFSSAVDMLPRDLLTKCREHLERCLAAGAITELASFGSIKPPVKNGNGKDFDALLKTVVSNPPADGLPDVDDGPRFVQLLIDVLHCHRLEYDPNDGIDVAIDGNPALANPPLHARFCQIHRAEGDREVHHCFRVLPHTAARAFQARLKAAMTASGIDMALPFRHLVVIRQTKPPSGSIGKRLCADFDQAGGRMVAISPEDLRTMVALQTMLHQATDGFEAWLRQCRPVSNLVLFRETGRGRSAGSAENPPGPKAGAKAELLVGPPASSGIPAHDISTPPPEAPPATSPQLSPDVAIPLGRRLVGGVAERATSLPLHLLTRHTAVLAGSGSGKTVLLRRIIEEAALLGVPAIVLDPNNDLARMGDPWPEPQADWSDTDHAKAAIYHRTVETIVWTPGINGGNPIKLAPLPDFASVRDDPDELGQAVAMAVSSLGQLVGMQGAKGRLRRGVLSQALAYFAQSAGAELDALVRLLSDLPPGVSDIGNATKLARDMADELKATIASSPLFASPGQPLDPRLLFTSAAHGKTRVSVINLSGLPTDEGRQDFVNQLQMALFAFIKRNPPPAGRPLTGLLVMDEAQVFAPSQTATACKDSTITLAGQARKYGLGMLFATQVPKNIDNKIISNCTTHFYGKMSSPASIQATQELIQSRGGVGNDIGTLKIGQFYLATEGMAAPQRIQTMLCLSYHPPAPLTPQEVLERARVSRALL